MILALLFTLMNPSKASMKDPEIERLLARGWYQGKPVACASRRGQFFLLENGQNSTDLYVSTTGDTFTRAALDGPVTCILVSEPTEIDEV